MLNNRKCFIFITSALGQAARRPAPGGHSDAIPYVWSIIPRLASLQPRPDSPGIGGRIESESVVGFARNMHPGRGPIEARGCISSFPKLPAIAGGAIITMRPTSCEDLHIARLRSPAPSPP